MAKRKRKLRKSFVVSLLVVFFIGLGFTLAQPIKAIENLFKEEEVEVKEESITIVDTSSESRPVAVMINNHSAARPYHSGLQDAYILYEIIAEGGYTRYMALFLDKSPERIGSVRSARHYFLDYVMENDAYYVHWGFSPQAKEDIEKYNIENINGLYYENKYFFRDKSLDVPLEHTGFTKMDLIKKGISSLGYRINREKPLLFDYTARDVMDGVEAESASNVDINFSKSVTTSYVYDQELGVYKRFVNDKPHSDYVTKKQYTFKNIIVYQLNNYSIDDYGRQEVETVGEGEGYYISNGKAIKIKWEKKSRDEQTKYKLLDGEELVLNDGNTFIEIQPREKELQIS